MHAQIFTVDCVPTVYTQNNWKLLAVIGPQQKEENGIGCVAGSTMLANGINLMPNGFYREMQTHIDRHIWAAFQQIARPV